MVDEHSSGFASAPRGEEQQTAPLMTSNDEQQQETVSDDVDYDDNEDDEYDPPPSSSSSSSSPTIWSTRNVVLSRCILAMAVLYAALLTYADHRDNNANRSRDVRDYPSYSRNAAFDESVLGEDSDRQRHRRLTAVMGDVVPSYMNDLNRDLEARKKLFDETPPEEVKYWFEYTGPLQVRIPSPTRSNTSLGIRWNSCCGTEPQEWRSGIESCEKCIVSNKFFC